MRYAPETVVWEITYRCNVNCIHCGSDCASVVKENELTTPECLDLIEDLADIGAGTIILSGGEPLMRKDFATIAIAIKRLGMQVAFISNGFMLNEDTVKVIKEIKPRAYGISIDAADPYLHDYIRGKEGCFEHLDRGIDLLLKNGVLPSVVTTVHKINYTQLSKIRDYLIKKGIRLWQIQYGDHIGRMPRNTMITEAQFLEIAKFILETREKYGEHFESVSGADVFGYLGDLGKKVQGPWWGCAAGMKALGLGSDGTVRGCLSLQRDEYIEGNIRERSLKEIWNDKNSFKYNRRFDCSMLTGYCKDCVYASVCRGGCTRSATSTGGRCNPYCLYQIEKSGFSSEEQARTEFTKEELFMLYNSVRPLPEEFLKQYK